MTGNNKCLGQRARQLQPDRLARKQQRRGRQRRLLHRRGRPQNRSFTLVYAQSSNVMGLNGTTDAYAHTASAAAVSLRPRVHEGTGLRLGEDPGDAHRGPV